MRVPKGNSLAYRMKVTSLLASGTALVTLTVAFLIFDAISYRALLQNRLATLADVVGQNSTAALSFDDPAAAVEILEALRAEPPVVCACLYDVSGRLFAGYQRQPGRHECPRALTQSPPANRDLPAVLRPVMRHGELVGTLGLSSDLQEMERRRKQMLWVAALLAVMALVAGGVSGALLQRKISRPIFEMARAMDEVTVRKNFSLRVSRSGTDEIRQLGKGFNAMLAELERREGAQKDAEAKLQFQALNDALTGLPNRRLLSDRLNQLLAIARRESRLIALLYIDLDGFKLVNDSLGHALGDALLVQVAKRLQSRVRLSDTLARLGGDEFTVVLANLHNKDEAMKVATSLLDCLMAPFLIEGHQLMIGASIGISTFPESANDASDLMQQADSAMYAAKRGGRNRATAFTPDLGSAVRERLNLENQLRGAVARGEIDVHYQPEFDVNTKRLVRFEALARWTHPTLGDIPPDKFIPIAEESGLIVTLGAYILERACTEALRWQAIAPYPVQVAVNVSSIQFKREHFAEEVSTILKQTGLNPELLQLELTETVMLSGVARASETMQRLRALGVSFAIDDFGTGYSCLSYLPQMPFNALKIDRSFVKQLDMKPESRAMVNSLIALAHNIGIRVIVEGVETEEQLALIRKFGGNEIQGFLLGRPTADPATKLSSFLDSGMERAEIFSEIAVEVHRDS
jgi:diguanylate cyclase